MRTSPWSLELSQRSDLDRPASSPIMGPRRPPLRTICLLIESKAALAVACPCIRRISAAIATSVSMSERSGMERRSGARPGRPLNRPLVGSDRDVPDHTGRGRA